MNVNAESFPRRHRITVEDYHRMGEAGIFSEDDRVELIEGEVIDMEPIGSKHANTVDEFVQLIARQLPKKGRLRVQNPVLLNDGSEPQPDLAIVANRSYSAAHPSPEDILLLIEVADVPRIRPLGQDSAVRPPRYSGSLVGRSRKPDGRGVP